MTQDAQNAQIEDGKNPVVMRFCIFAEGIGTAGIAVFRKTALKHITPLSRRDVLLKASWVPFYWTVTLM